MLTKLTKLKKLMRLVILLLLVGSFSVAQTTLPDSPSAVRERNNVKPVHFYTYRTDWQAPLLRSNKDVFKSKSFWLLNIGLWTSVIVACRNKNSGEHFHSEAPAAAGITALGYLSYRTMSGLVMAGGNGYGIVYYSIAAAK